jgi:hypothetical protein
MSSSSAGVLLISGSALFFVGAGIAVPAVFTEPDREEKRRLLAEHPVRWQVGQPLYALGAVVAALGVLPLAADGTTKGSSWLIASCALLVLGALAWSWSVYLRGTRPEQFALGELPGWPFTAYVWLTLAGLLLLGLGLRTGDPPDWLAWLVLGSAAVFGVVYVRYRDLPPFVFYLVLTVVGAAVL